MSVLSASPVVQLGPRPYWLIDQMRDGPLKDRLGTSQYLQPQMVHWGLTNPECAHVYDVSRSTFLFSPSRFRS